MYKWLKTGDTHVIKVNSADYRIVIEKLVFAGTDCGITFNSNTYPLVGHGEFCETPIDKGQNLTVTATTGTVFVRWRQERL